MKQEASGPSFRVNYFNCLCFSKCILACAIYGLFPQYPQKLSQLGELLFLSVPVPSSRRGCRQAAACPTAPTTHPLPPAPLQKAPLEAESAPAFAFERGGPVCEPRDNFLLSARANSRADIEGRNQSLPQFGRVPAACQAWLLSCFTSIFPQQGSTGLGVRGQSSIKTTITTWNCSFLNLTQPQPNLGNERPQ